VQLDSTNEDVANISGILEVTTVSSSESSSREPSPEPLSCLIINIQTYKGKRAHGNLKQFVIDLTRSFTDFKAKIYPIVKKKLSGGTKLQTLRLKRI